MIRRLEFYFSDKKKVHINCISGRFYNGIIKKIQTREKMIILLDDKLGELPISFNEIKTIEPFRKEVKND